MSARTGADMRRSLLTLASDHLAMTWNPQGSAVMFSYPIAGDGEPTDLLAMLVCVPGTSLLSLCVFDKATGSVICRSKPVCPCELDDTGGPWPSSYVAESDGAEAIMEPAPAWHTALLSMAAKHFAMRLNPQAASAEFTARLDRSANPAAVCVLLMCEPKAALFGLCLFRKVDGLHLCSSRPVRLDALDVTNWDADLQ